MCPWTQKYILKMCPWTHFELIFNFCVHGHILLLTLSPKNYIIWTQINNRIHYENENKRFKDS